MVKMLAWQRKIAVRSILWSMVLAGGSVPSWRASDFLGMTQSSKSTIIKELDRLCSLGYVVRIEQKWRSNAPVYFYSIVELDGYEVRVSKHWYTVLKTNILGVHND